MTFGSLFSGIGGLDLGLERAGLVCKWQVEIDGYATRVLEKHWPDVPRYRDVTKFCRRVYGCKPESEDGEVICPRCDVEFSECGCIGTDQLIDECGTVDLVCGGDPCQGNSNAKTHGQTAITLGDEFIRVIDELHPRYVLRENPATIKKDAPWPWWRFAIRLEELGYVARPFRFRACCAGADHRRDRMFVFAVLQDADSPRLEGHEREVMAGENDGRQNPDIAGPDRWNAAPRICGRVDGVPNRVDRLRCLGNAVVPQVAELIGRQILESVVHAPAPPAPRNRNGRQR